MPKLLLSGLLVAYTCTAMSQQFVGIRENLGPALNDVRDQLLPVFSPGGDTLFLSEQGTDGNYRIMYSVRQAGGEWSEKKRFEPLDAPSDGSRYVFGVLDEQHYLVNGVFIPSGNGSYQQRVGLSCAAAGSKPSDWRALPLGDGDSFFTGAFANAFLHRSSKSLWLSFGQTGNTDLYLCLPENPQEMNWEKIRWGAPVRLPEPLNSSSEDTTPFLTADGSTLYFASNRPGGYGAEDIYKASCQGTDWMTWSVPENVGFQVNSNKAELYFVMSPDQQEAWFVSYKFSAGGGDLFRIRTEPENVSAEEANAEPAAKAPEELPAPQVPTPQEPATLALSEKLYKPNNIVFLLDQSASMKKEHRLPMLRASMEGLLDALRQMDRIEMLGFGSSVVPLYASEDVIRKDSVLNLLDSFQANAVATNGSKAILEGYKAAEKRWIEGANNEIFLITDGLFTISPATEMLIRSRTNVQLTVVVIADTEGGNQLIQEFSKFPNVQIIRMTNLERDRDALLENVRRNALR